MRHDGKPGRLNKEHTTSPRVDASVGVPSASTNGACTHPQHTPARCRMVRLLAAGRAARPDPNSQDYTLRRVATARISQLPSALPSNTVRACAYVFWVWHAYTHTDAYPYADACAATGTGAGTRSETGPEAGTDGDTMTKCKAQGTHSLPCVLAGVRAAGLLKEARKCTDLLIHALSEQRPDAGAHLVIFQRLSQMIGARTRRHRTKIGDWIRTNELHVLFC